MSAPLWFWLPVTVMCVGAFVGWWYEARRCDRLHARLAYWVERAEDLTTQLRRRLF